MEANPEYRTLHFIVKYGDWIARLAALAVVAGGLVLWLAGAPVWIAAAGLLGGALLYLVLQSYAELVRVIVDMLLPK